MVTCWLLIDTIAMSASPAFRGADVSVDRAERDAASAGDAMVSAVSAAVAASVTMAAGRHRRIAQVELIVMDFIVLDRFVMPMPWLKCLPRASARGTAANKHWTPVDGSCFPAPRQQTLAQGYQEVGR